MYTTRMHEFVEHGGERYLRIHPQAIDFSNAGTAHKVTDDFAVHVTIPIKAMETRINGHLETTKNLNQGDWLLYNIGNVDPAVIDGYDQMSPVERILARAERVEHYILSDRTFKTTHGEFKALAHGVLAAPISNPRPAMNLPFNAVFKASWGSDEFVKAGGVIVKNGEKIYGIEKNAFQRTYGAIEQTKPFSESHAAQILARTPIMPEVAFKPEQAADYAKAIASLRQKQ